MGGAEVNISWYHVVSMVGVGMLPCKGIHISPSDGV